MEILNLMYKYINRFITLEKLLEELNNVDITKYKKSEQKEIKELINKLNNINETIPNETDEREKARQLGADRIIKELNEAIKKMKNPDDVVKVQEHIKEIEDSKKEKKDGGERFNKTFETLTTNKLINRYTENMTKDEMLDFITQYIHVELPPKLSNEELEELITIGINRKNKEKLWRLAFNYENSRNDFKRIIDYYVEEKDYWYLGELMSALYGKIDFDYIKQEVNKTQDQHFINNFNNYIKHLSLD